MDNNMDNMNNEEFKKEVFDLVGAEYSALSNYVNSKTKIRVKHEKCGCEYETLPSAFLAGFRCPSCASGRKKAN